MAGWRKTASAARRITAGSLKVRERRERGRGRHAAPRENKRALTASAAVIKTDRGSTIAKKAWQDEAWEQYRANGELWYAVEWLSNAISRVRLKAGKIVDGGDEPEIVEDGPVAEIMEALGGGLGGQSALLKSFTIKLMVPGDSYLVGYETSLGTTHWDVYSVDVVRKDMSGGFSIRVDESNWVALPQESLVVRIWNADEQFPWLAISPTMPALGVLREVDLYNRKIITQLTSRLASNGVLFLPEEAMYATRDEFNDAVDPLVADLVDVAAKAIQNPGSAAAALPIPLRMTAEYIDKIKLMTFADNVTDEALQGREAALKRLATMLNIPPEVLTGMGGTNHWSANAIEAQAIKVNIAPVVETICRGLTEGYLLPALAEAGLAGYGDVDNPEEIEYEGARYVVWYDASELEEKPDLGERAVQLHDRVAISDAALREATGFDESAAPTDAEREQQILTRLAYNGQQPTPAFELLTGTPVPAPAATPAQGANLPAPGAGTGADQERPTSRGPSNDGVPGTPGAPPNTSGDVPPSTSLDIPTRLPFGDGYDLVLTPRNGEKVH